MTPITVDLTSDQAEHLRRLSASLNMEPRQLVLEAVKSLLQADSDDFKQAASYVLKKNRELYEQLS